MKGVLVLIVAHLFGCASMEVRREILDEHGRVIGTIVVRHRATTAEGATAILDGARGFEESQRHELEDLGALSVDKGQPTTVTTPRGAVTSGYTGYAGYDPYSFYGRYGIDPSMLPSGTTPEMALGDMLSRMRSLPMLIEPGTMPYAPYPYMQPQPGQVVIHPDGTVAVCPIDRPPANDAERIACIEQQVWEMTLMHRTR